MTELIWDLQRFATAVTAINAHNVGTETSANTGDGLVGLDELVKGSTDRKSTEFKNGVTATYSSRVGVYFDGSSQDDAFVQEIKTGTFGDGNDTVSVTMDLSAGNFDNDIKVTGISGAIALTGGSGDDQFYVDATASKEAAYVGAESGNNTLVLAGNNGTIEGGTGDDSGNFTGKGGYVNLGSGNNEVEMGGATASTLELAEDSANAIAGFFDSAKTDNILVLNDVDFDLGVDNGTLVLESDTVSASLASYANDTKIKWATADNDALYTAKISNGKQAMTYEGDVNQYFGTTDADTVKVSGSSRVSVWMDGADLYSGDAASQYAGIEVLDASASTGRITIAGSSNVENTILGGSGSGSIWGGFGDGDDVLVGKAGSKLNYVVGNAEGNDVITSKSEKDTVKFWNANLSDVSSATRSAGVIEIEMNGGNTITVNTKKSITFELADGTKYVSNTDGTWDQK